MLNTSVYGAIDGHDAAQGDPAMRCERCGWPSAGATVLSTHHTSQGSVRYRRCVCGMLSIELATLNGSGRTRIEAVIKRPER
jgi:hypothetical protein